MKHYTSTTGAPHPVEQIKNANLICVQCHVVSGKHWDTFFKMPPCGTVAEIKAGHGEPFAETVEEMRMDDIASLGCVECHMPAVERPLVNGGSVRKVRQHLWRGGHDPDMVKQGLAISFQQKTDINNNTSLVLNITNSGAAHFLPTGTPDRHLTAQIRALDKYGTVVKETTYKMKRTVMWRPFIVDLWDTRLPRGEQRKYILQVENIGDVAYVDAEVRYHLLDEARRRRIGYENQSPIYYPVFHQQQPVALSTRTE